MPDTFFRKISYGAAAVALGAGAFIVTNRETPLAGQSEIHSAESLPAYLRAHQPVQTQRADSVQGESLWVPSVHAERTHSVATAQADFGDRQGDRQGVRQTQRDAFAATTTAPVYESMISIDRDAIELSVPIDARSGMPAHVPIALALAMDPTDVPPQMQEAVREMSMDFLENVANAAAVANSPQNADYFERWQSAAYLSDRNFKMRYGRVAFVRMNLLLAQEASAGVR